MTQESLFIICIIMAVIMVSMGAVWVYKDAKSRGLNGLLWAFITFITSFLGVLLYFLFGRRSGRTYCKTCLHEVVPSGCYSQNHCHYCNHSLDKEEIVTPATFVSGKIYIVIAVICFLIMLLSFAWLLVQIAQNHLK